MKLHSYNDRRLCKRWLAPTPYLSTLVVGIIVSASAAADAAAPAHAPDLPTRGICAHRGASATHPENTLSALHEAVRLGAHMIEFDVALTKDGELILMHDLTVDRTTNGQGRVKVLTLAEIRKLDAGNWRGEQFAGERVPTLSEALAIMPLNVWLNVHLKGGPELAEKTARELQASDRLRQAFLACDTLAAAAARRAAPEMMICNMERQTSPANYARLTIECRAEFIQLLGSRQTALEQVPRLRRHGVRINYCCTNDAEQLRALLTAGVEFPLVDQVAAMIAAAKDFGITPLQPVFRQE